MSSHRRIVAALTCVLLVSLAGCTGFVQGVEDDAVVADASSASPSAPSGATPSTVSVPLMQTTTGVPFLYAEISVGGSAPFTVLVDSGSSGLFVDKAVLGPDVTTSTTAYTSPYVGFELDAELATGTFSIGGATTSAPITFGVYTSQPGDQLWSSAAQGIMGIAPSGDGASVGLYSPLIQLPAPYNQGWQIDIPSTGTGSLQVGAPTTTEQTITLPLTSAQSPIPGVSFWEKDVSLCWTLGSGTATCGPTDLDSGAHSTLLDTSVASGLSIAGGSEVAPGQPISLTTPAGVELWSFTTGTTAANNLAEVSSLSHTKFNTGLGFFYTHVVGFDWATGQLALTPQS